jgi:membrane-associated phospholipid phosphatase
MRSTALVAVNRWFRSVKPLQWVLMLILLIGMFAVFVPTAVWQKLFDALWYERTLTGALLLFALVSVSLVWAGGQRIDAALFEFFNSRGPRTRVLDILMLAVTQLGNGAVALILAPIIFLEYNHLIAYQLALGTLFLWLVVEIVKSIALRTRPYSKVKNARVVGVREKGYSFPSGHTSQAFFMATVMGRYFDGGFHVYVILYLTALAVGVTRMYVGVHYPRDVLAGACLGTAWGLIGTLMYCRLCA